MSDFSNATAALAQEYRDAVQSLADDLIGAIGDSVTTRNEFIEHLHESVDSHSWVIYTTKAQVVALVSDNAGRAVSEFGAEFIVENGEISWSRIAYAALEQDVIDEILRCNVNINDDDLFSIATHLSSLGIDTSSVGDGYDTVAHLAAAWIESDTVNDPLEWIAANVVDPEIALDLECSHVDPEEFDDLPAATKTAFAEGKLTDKDIKEAVTNGA